MKSNLIKNTSLYTFGNVLPKLVGFFLIPIYTRFLTPADYGIISSMRVLSSILVVFFTLGVNRSIPRLFYDYKNNTDRKKYLGTLNITIFGISTIILILIFTFKNYVNLIYESIDFYPYFVLVIISAYLGTFSYIPMTYLRLKEKVNAFVGISLARFFIQATFKIVLVVFLLKGAYGAIIGGFFSNLLILPLFIIISFKIMSFSFDKNILKDSLKYSLPLLPGILCAWILNLSDRIFIERYFSLSEVGIYSLGYQFAGYILFFTEAFNKAYEPIFYSMANSDKPVEFVKKILAKYNYNYIMTIVFFCFLLALFSKEVIEILLDSRYHEAYKITMLIAIAYCISQCSHILGMSIHQDRKTTFTMYSVLSAAVTNILLNFLLIPILGIYGAAYATIFSFCLQFSLYYYFSKKCYFIPIKWGNIFSNVLLLVFITTIFYFLFIKISVYISLAIKIGAVILLCLTLYRKILIQNISKLKS